MLRESSVPTTLFALRVLRRVDCEATCREGVRAACALAQRVFRERDVSSLDTCIEAFACVQHAPPSAQRTLSAHLFHYGSRLYADKAYAQAARFVDLDGPLLLANDRELLAEVAADLWRVRAADPAIAQDLVTLWSAGPEALADDLRELVRHEVQEADDGFGVIADLFSKQIIV